VGDTPQINRLSFFSLRNITIKFAHIVLFARLWMAQFFVDKFITGFQKLVEHFCFIDALIAANHL
jgi:hypothetical protein